MPPVADPLRPIRPTGLAYLEVVTRLLHDLRLSDPEGGLWEAADLHSNMFEMEWPPKSGRRQMFPERDRAAWFGVAEANNKILKGQAIFLGRLIEALAGD